MPDNRLVFIKPIGAIKASNGEYLPVYDSEKLEELDAVGIAPSAPSQEELKKIYIEQETKKHMAAKKNFNIELDKPSSIVEEIINPQTATPEAEEEKPKTKKQSFKSYTLNLEADQMEYLKVYAMVQKKQIKQVIEDALEAYYSQDPQAQEKTKEFLAIWK